MDKTKPGVKITLDRERTLLLDLNGMAAYEDIMGKSLFTTDMAQIGARELRAILWSGLIHEDESLTLKQVGSWITQENMAAVANSISEAFKKAMPAPSGDSADPLASRPTG